MGYGGAELAVGLGLLCVHVYPLVVECGVGKEVDTLLCELYEV